MSEGRGQGRRGFLKCMATMKVPAERLGQLLGVRTVTDVLRAGPLAVVDHPLT